MEQELKRQEYWSRNLRITALLLALWFVVTFVIGFYARDLSFNFFGWPFSFYMAAQGSLIVYVWIIWYYASYMNRLDKEFGVDEGDDGVQNAGFSGCFTHSGVPSASFALPAWRRERRITRRPSVSVVRGCRGRPRWRSDRWRRRAHVNGPMRLARWSSAVPSTCRWPG